MFSIRNRILLKIRISRFFRGIVKDIKRFLSKDKSGTPRDLLGDSILPEEPKKDNTKKYKSTAVIFVSGVAMGISHVGTAASRYNKKVSTRYTVCTGLVVGIVSSYVWFNYVKAANEGVSEKDISMMMSMANNTGLGKVDEDDTTSKAMDILHTMVTGKVHLSEDYSPAYFSDEDKKERDEDDEDDDDDEDISMFRTNNTLAETVEVDKEKPSIPVRPIGIGKPTLNPKSSIKSPFIPKDDYSDEFSETKYRESLTKNKREGWLHL